MFPDGTQVLASGWLQRKEDELAPDFGLYLDPQWRPTGPAAMLDWPDFGVPSDRSAAAWWEPGPAVPTGTRSR